MTSFFQKVLNPNGRGHTRSRRVREQRIQAQYNFVEKSRRITFLIFSITTAILILTAFLGQAPSGPRLLPEQVAKTRVIADLDFQYESAILTERKSDRIQKQIPPVYSVDFTHFSSFEVYINELNEFLVSFSREHSELEMSEQIGLLDTSLREWFAAQPYAADINSILTVYQETENTTNYRVLQQGLTLLWNIYRQGIFAPITGIVENDSTLNVVQIVDDSGEIKKQRYQEVSEALIRLRQNLSGLQTNEAQFFALFEILKEGIKPNLFYNELIHQQLTQEALAQIQPEIINVQRGDTIIELGSIVSRIDIEKLDAYEDSKQDIAEQEPFFGEFMLQRIFYTLIIMASLGLLMHLLLSGRNRTNRSYTMMAIIVLFNIAAIRFVLEIGESDLFDDTGAFNTLLIYAPPFLIAPVVINLLLGVTPAILCAILVSALYSMMQGNNTEMFLFVLLYNAVAILVSCHARVRSRIVNACFVAGLTLALLVAIQGFFDGESFTIIGQKIILLTVLSVIYGMLIVGIVPIMEAIFKVSSDITLLELTDFNHPLLRKMQMEAPGTYHHSLMVANIAEKAALEVGANPLVCRTCSLFHDIGKLQKPEYFAENQQVGAPNPHDNMKPSMSALVIKNHVSEGVDMARKYSLPRIVIDIIRQHHAASLIRYFYMQAIKETMSIMKIDEAEAKAQVDQSNYRYEGPKPQFKESAIIFLADSVEAASRSLKKVNQQSVEDLIDSIIRNATSDQQLDDAPLSFQELASIRTSFIMSVLNMLHSRVEYPKSAEAKTTRSVANVASN